MRRPEIDDIVTDYEAHFSETRWRPAASENRRWPTSLGDPSNWAPSCAPKPKLQRSGKNGEIPDFFRAGAAVYQVTQAFNILILLPVIAALLFCAGITPAYVLYTVASTGLHLVAGLMSGNGNVLVPALVGLGMICGVVCIGSVISVAAGLGPAASGALCAC